MSLLPKKKFVILLTSLALIAVGFISMKLEPAAHGFGPWALTAAPLLVIAGFTLGHISIFYGAENKFFLKTDRPFLIAGWASFVASLAVYLITLEETASLWDCAEFIACAYKLQVPHAPGAPLFLIIGRLFSMLAFGNTQLVAYWVNVSSAVSSALAVMFAFWSVVMLGRKAHAGASTPSLIIAGSVGAFTIAFADSFWYSAVEAETYAMATLFLIVCFWAILKWGQCEKSAQGYNWLIFIFYMLGLSIGVHPLSLLILPAIAITIMFKHKNFSWKNLILATAIGALGIFILNHVLLFGLPDAMKYFDIFFVNSLHMPFYAGAIALLILLLAAGYAMCRWSVKSKRTAASIFIVGILYFLIGYSSYFMIIIRSQQDPSIDEHNPENLMTLTSYLKRESYGSRPFLYGQNFTAKVTGYKKGSPVFTKLDDSYTITDHKTEYVYEEDQQTIFPRMYSNQEKHIASYKQWTGLKNDETPSFHDNLNFMFRYQFGHMYFRYLMFNFSGRESDVQHADWLRPISILGDFPSAIKNNPAHNNLLMLPLLIGILGMMYQHRKDRKGFWSVMAFFLFLGLILVFYLNSPPNEPRERDYIYVGSYLAFALWCGLGALGIMEFLLIKLAKYPALRYAGIFTIIIPIMMLVVGFDDHDRSGRGLQIDHARNILNSCAPNAVLFTGGDNDTFPLWYVQEVEGFRTDVRVIVLSYFNGDWYIDQMQRKMYASDPLPFSLNIDQYRQGGLNDILPYAENPSIKGAINLRKFLDLVRAESKSLQVSMAGGTIYNAIPSRVFFLDIDQELVGRYGIVPSEFHAKIPKKLHLRWNGNFMEKSTLMVLDLIAKNDWCRPIYFNLTSLNSIGLDLKKHVLQEGQVYRLLPIELEREDAVDVEQMYENLMEKAVFRNLDSGGVYYNHEDYQLRILQTTKSTYNVLANQLLDRGDDEKAREVINFIAEHLVKKNISLDVSTLSTIDLLFKTGQPGQAQHLADSLFDQSSKMLAYLNDKQNINAESGQMHLFIVRQLYNIGIQNGRMDFAEECSSTFNDYVSAFSGS
jgi:MFS family permease